MSKKKNRPRTAGAESQGTDATHRPDDDALPPARPPRKNLAMLIVSATLLGLWLVFLLATALTGW